MLLISWWWWCIATCWRPSCSTWLSPCLPHPHRKKNPGKSWPFQQVLSVQIRLEADSKFSKTCYMFLTTGSAIKIRKKVTLIKKGSRSPQSELHKKMHNLSTELITCLVMLLIVLSFFWQLLFLNLLFESFHPNYKEKGRQMFADFQRYICNTWWLESDSSELLLWMESR